MEVFADSFLLAVLADKRLCSQSKLPLEAGIKGRYLRHTGDLRCVVLEFVKRFFLRFGQRLRQLFFVAS